MRDLLKLVDRNGKGIALVVGDGNRLLATITDGDIRRAVLEGLNLDATVLDLMEERSRREIAKPISVLEGTPEEVIFQLMRRHGLRHIPIVDREGRLIDLVLSPNIRFEDKLPVRAVIMAGGSGLRLRPLTQAMPKPMLHVGDRPLLERTVRHLSQAGIYQIVIAVHYLANKIVDYFGDGKSFGVDISYIEEKIPLGTAGALSLISPMTGSTLVINGDVLTNINVRALIDFHRDQNAELTIGVSQYDVGIPYGVVKMEGAHVKSITEKPMVHYFVNAGIYLMESALQTKLRPGEPCSMTDFLTRILADGHQVIGFPIQEYWMDIGQWGNYQQAQEDVSANDEEAS